MWMKLLLVAFMLMLYGVGGGGKICIPLWCLGFVLSKVISAIADSLSGNKSQILKVDWLN